MDVARLFREYMTLDRRRREGLTPRELHRWKLLKRELSQHFTPGVSEARADQRESVRIPTRLRVEFRTGDDLKQCLMTNLSRKGLFVQTAHPLDIGTRIDLRIRLRRPARELDVPAEVVSHDFGPRLGPARGMGLRLLDLDPEQDKQLEELYEQLGR